MTSKRGRPPNSEAGGVSNALLDATFALLRIKSHVDITMGEVAKIAGTQPSMIRYYFGDKDGLLAAVSDVLARHTDEKMAEVERSFDPTKGAAGPIIRALVEIYYNPPLYEAGSIMVIEALRPNSVLIGNFRSRTAKKTVVRMMRMIRSCVANGRYHYDLNIPTAILSIMSLTTGPMACAPMFEAGQNGTAFDQETWINDASLMLEHAFGRDTNHR
ncbi:TetR/AcrR family transcriptional regulator [Sphingomonas aliaeris]|uniref:TetR/AcrR family transcriptional regulator n=1 Tax=Sphingomonas aliaeris TaxID=2759526 RepID=A0A974S4L3_9SPHN|nr:TetR/AcrR family transcriptional regulator [Sphingomonas aliaeris]QQV77651.1 TetR/AcrR family transcriptional regulator [Sphingomonas aliaeris]